MTGQIVFTVALILLAAIGGYKAGYSNGHEDGTREELMHK